MWNHKQEKNQRGQQRCLLRHGAPPWSRLFVCRLHLPVDAASASISLPYPKNVSFARCIAPNIVLSSHHNLCYTKELIVRICAFGARVYLDRRPAAILLFILLSMEDP
jgi:hypothetical protein